MLIGAQQVWAHFPKKKFAKVSALAVSLPRISDGAKEWQTGSRFRSSQNWEVPRLYRRLRKSAQRLQKLPPRAAAYRGNIGKSGASLMRLSRPSSRCLRNQA